MPEARPESFDDLVDAIARALEEPADPSADTHERASAIAGSAGLRALFDDLTMAERILRTGEGFHSIERFFVDNSDEQRYLMRLHARTER